MVEIIYNFGATKTAVDLMIDDAVADESITVTFTDALNGAVREVTAAWTAFTFVLDIA